MDTATSERDTFTIVYIPEYSKMLGPVKYRADSYEFVPFRDLKC